MKLNIAMLLPPPTAMKAIGLSGELAGGYETYFKLSMSDCYPHVTVYSTEFPYDKKREVVSATKSVVRGMKKKLYCTVKQVETHQGYLGVELVRTPQIMEFHEKVVEKLAYYRMPKQTGAEGYGMDFSQEQMMNEELYGYADAMDLYNPHFTVTRFKEEQVARDLLPTIEWQLDTFSICDFGIFEMGDHGTCTKLVEDFSIQT